MVAWLCPSLLPLLLLCEPASSSTGAFFPPPRISSHKLSSSTTDAFFLLPGIHLTDFPALLHFAFNAATACNPPVPWPFHHPFWIMPLSILVASPFSTASALQTPAHHSRFSYMHGSVLWGGGMVRSVIRCVCVGEHGRATGPALVCQKWMGGWRSVKSSVVICCGWSAIAGRQDVA